MREMTILEALAEARLLQKKIADKQRQVQEHLTRPKSRVDPLEKEGGSVNFVKESLQSIRDMESSVIGIREAIAEASANNYITVGNLTMTVSSWLVWRREILPLKRMFVQHLATKVETDRRNLKEPRYVDRQQVTPGDDLEVHISEIELARMGEELTEIEERLDGQISLMDAKTIVKIP